MSENRDTRLARIRNELQKDTRAIPIADYIEFLKDLGSNDVVNVEYEDVVKIGDTLPQFMGFFCGDAASLFKEEKDKDGNIEKKEIPMFSFVDATTPERVMRVMAIHQLLQEVNSGHIVPGDLCAIQYNGQQDMGARRVKLISLARMRGADGKMLSFAPGSTGDRAQKRAIEIVNQTKKGEQKKTK